MMCINFVSNNSGRPPSACDHIDAPKMALALQHPLALTDTLVLQGNLFHEEGVYLLELHLVLVFKFCYLGAKPIHL